MIEIRRILCPTDLSDVAPRAFDHALALARFHQAEVELAYVSEPLLPGPVAPASYPPWAVLDPAVRGRLQSALETLAAPARGEGRAGPLRPVRGPRRPGDPRARAGLAGRRRRDGHPRPGRVRALGPRLGHREGAAQGALPGAHRAPARGRASPRGLGALPPHRLPRGLLRRLARRARLRPEARRGVLRRDHGPPRARVAGRGRARRDASPASTCRSSGATSRRTRATG